MEAIVTASTRSTKPNVLSCALGCVVLAAIAMAV